jgi:hypothetical protein
MSNILINNHFLLEKFPGKGGWTFARLPDIKHNKSNPFGWEKVRGSIDGFEIRHYHLMPMGNGHLFLPVKAEIRKKIKKEAGQLVHIILLPETEAIEIPDELLSCLAYEPQAFSFFNALTESEKKHYIQWIFSAKKEETKVERIAKALNRMLMGLKMYDQDPRLKL